MQYGRLLDALAAGFAARIRAAEDPRDPSLDGLLVVGREVPNDVEVPSLMLELPESAEPGSRRLRLTSARAIDERLRARTFTERYAGLPVLDVQPGDEVLAETSVGPFWVARAGTRSQRASLVPAELEPHEPLRARFTPGRVAALLPVAAFLRSVWRAQGWRPPPLRACFVFDDPNLRRPTYGYIEYARLAAHARAEGYHAAMAMIPLDARCASRGAVAIFRGNSTLSLLVHGNDHLKRELARPLDVETYAAVFGQARERIERFERRTGLAVDRLMVPPHGACSPAAAAALVSAGFEGLVMSPFDDAAAPSGCRVVARWHPAQLTTGGAAVIPRQHLIDDREDLALRSFLGQPIILYGHHHDVARSLDVLSEAVADVDALGDVEWVRPSRVGEAAYTSARAGRSLHVTVHARRVRFDVPDWADNVVVEAGAPLARNDSLLVSSGARRLAGAGERIGVTDVRELVVAIERRTEPSSQGRVPRNPWALPRRFLAEGRDRLQPLLRR